ncbi:MAG TPA: magnesium chelatase domain-containing protein [Sedimentisphaerales bacterium]|nr:magnesium chelatase domain-containing protein [Sedimentisphaerales bacterium]
MLAKLKTFSLLGIEAVPVEVEVDVSPAGLPKTILVGLPEAAVKESTHRVERAMVNSGFQRPQSRVVINLARACSHLSPRKKIAFPRLSAQSPVQSQPSALFRRTIGPSGSFGVLTTCSQV